MDRTEKVETALRRALHAEGNHVIPNSTYEELGRINIRWHDTQHELAKASEELAQAKKELAEANEALESLRSTLRRVERIAKNEIGERRWLRLNKTVWRLSSKNAIA